MKVLILSFLFFSTAFAKSKTQIKMPSYFDTNGPEVERNLKNRGFEFTVNHSLKKDCRNGNKLSCAILKYRKKKTKKNAKKVSRILRRYPCRVSKMSNCVEHLFARIYMEKHKAALKLARKMCRHEHESACRQLAHYRSMGALGKLKK
jgi:hypothetical protein